MLNLKSSDATEISELFLWKFYQDQNIKYEIHVGLGKMKNLVHVTIRLFQLMNRFVSSAGMKFIQSILWALSFL